MLPRDVARNTPYLLPRATPSVSFTPGELRPTGGRTEVAIEGAGFFEIQLPGGGVGYTRDGQFEISAQGQLVTKQGYLVMGDGGPIQLDRNNGAPISISARGDIVQGTDRKGRIKVVEFNDPRLLTPTAGGLFLSQNPELRPNELRDPVVRQGFLEAANTSSVAEMANLISVMRSYEANQRVIQAQDDRMSRIISELGSPT